MARPRELDLDVLLDHVRAIWVADGIAAVTIRAVSARAGVSNGAIYHHFESRNHLLARAFAREIAAYLAVQRQRVVAASRTGGPEDVVVAAALTPAAYAETTADSALVLLATRLAELASGPLPDAVIEELSAHASAVATLVGELTERLWGRTDDAATRLVRYCIDDIPVRLLITSRRASDPLAAYAVEHAVRGILRAGPPPD
ncbi:TetR/AcrR family transcriptional regulator [Nocardioides nitrophenolicus]|uniref:TetR/AcrR family transcriptional regulator n=1 Tax=Nocardioides nitrophenolicus TaxID=60489 RepID=UPI00195EC389|nr:TetR/AcrR family transcriptional regulator [Nocardioides nitrophenolicus]MBM7517917.1 AcrR family transcriptional regulator [Nocardioides nitrophenolicus]